MNIDSSLNLFFLGSVYRSDHVECFLIKESIIHIMNNSVVRPLRKAVVISIVSNNLFVLYSIFEKNELL